MHWRVEMYAILTHFSPLLTTFHASRQYKLIAFFALPLPAIYTAHLQRCHAASFYF